MACHQAENIDIEAFLIDSGDERLAEFRAHFPGCPDCSVAVARWSAFDLAVRSISAPEGVATGGHPSLEDLERLIDSPTSEEAEEIMTRNHVDRCRQCQTDVNALVRFDPARLASVAAAAGSSSASTSAFDRDGNSIFDSVRGFFESLGDAWSFDRTVMVGVAVAMLVMLGIWMSGGFAGAPEQPAGKIQLTERSTLPSPSPIHPAPSDSKTGTAGMRDDDTNGSRDEGRVETLAVETAIDVPESDPQTRETIQPSPPRQLADAGDAAGPKQSATPSPVDAPEKTPLASNDPERSGDANDSNDAGVREEILLAALIELPLPTYDAPPGIDSVGWTQKFGAVRGSDLASLASQAPDHVGLTLSSAPTLWWDLYAPTDLPIRVTIVSDEAIEPILRIDLPGPHTTGLHSISLADHDVELQPNVDYRWFVTMIVDPDRPSRNPVSGGAIRVVPEADSRRAATQGVAFAERGHLLAKNGLWYDAYDFFATLSTAHPDVTPLARHRERMMELAHSRP